MSLDGTIGGLVDQGYILTQNLLIRKLLEKGKDGKKQVISLRRLVDDLAENRSLFTREIFVGFDGLPWDFEAVCQSEHEGWDGSLRWGHKDGPKAWSRSKSQHDAFSKIASTKADGFDRNEPLPDSVFDKLDQALKSPAFEKSGILTNKFLAHAAAPESRSSDAKWLKLKEYYDCHKAICQVTQFICLYLVQGSGLGGVAIPQYDQYEKWRSPFCPPDRIDDLDAEWRKQNKERRQWLYLSDFGQ